MSSSFTFSKLKSYLPTFSSTNENSDNSKGAKSKRNLFDTLDPEVGFKLQLEPASTQSGSITTTTTIPELKVTVIAARHLPNSFGLKSVEGYVIKVKLFPGTTRYDSSIQTSSWPTFNETFTFPLGSTTKSSFKSKFSRDSSASNSTNNANQTLPEKLFKGHFVVLTVFALLELPPGALPTMKDKFQKLKRKGSLLLSEKPMLGGGSSGGASGNDKKESSEDKDKVDIMKLTTSETRRNIGSVTCFLDPKIFEENKKSNFFFTEEMWLPIKDITVTPSSTSAYNVNTSPKGQIEIIMEICEADNLDTVGDYGDEDDRKLNSGGISSASPSSYSTPTPTNPMAKSARFSRKFAADAQQQQHQQSDDAHQKIKNPWNISDVKRKLSGYKKDKLKGMYFKITTSKMRCSIKVKEEFENVGAPIYVKTTIFEHDILSSYWRSDIFAPSLSTRWNPEESTIYIPLVDDDSLNNISIKVSVATKTKMGKKIFLGTLQLGPQSKGQKFEHWENMVGNKGTAITQWHSFE